MKALPVYAKTLLLQGASITGNFTEGYFFVEESLRVNHADELQTKHIRTQTIWKL